MYRVTKTYGHELGLSACFRQWRAKSHCRFLHGYPLSFKLTFEASVLDENNWVLDFGGLKGIKAWLVANFDHKLLVAEDDPQKLVLMELGCGHFYDEEGDLLEPALPLADIRIIPFVGCEGFAHYVSRHVEKWLGEEHKASVERRGLRLASVEVREHGGNSAIYTSRSF